MTILHDWLDIKDVFGHNLLLGNGASIAVHPDLSYKSLYAQACESGALTSNVQELFKTFHTENFEVLLRLLLHAKLINEAFNIDDEGKIGQAYQQVKDALVKTVIDVHPKYDRVNYLLKPIADFMRSFKRVFCLNYDLLVYWAMLVGNDQYGTWFKDAFIEEDGSFKNDYGFLFSPHFTATGATVVFYPHGNLFLATDFFGNEVKLAGSDEERLLEKLLSQWGKGNQIEDYIPLFVSEGNTGEKLHRIRRSNYLDTVYDSELSTLEDSLVIYGWRIDKQDLHILDAIGKGKLAEIAISIYKKENDWQSNCDEVEAKIRKNPGLKQCELVFFDAESEGCWIHQHNANAYL
ncbi:MAG: DUF4917 family protein [Chloroflexota bacterium]|nr:DUF4917 family protein [Chloroflexota bacterium]